MEPVRICVFAKPPLAGQVKTRLGHAVGPEAAAELALAFLHDTLALVRSLPWAELVLATTGDMTLHLPAGAPPPTWNQGQGDLGRRIERIMRRALVDRWAAIAIGADTPGLPVDFLEQGHAALASGHDAVVGPAEDGGFYLMGLRRCPEGLLDELPWSRSNTLQRTRERLVERGLSVKTIDSWFDVDRKEDLDRLVELIGEGKVEAPETARVLRRMRV
jgi:rSAM/selenodomain-associated transferase 1